ncbi:asparagine synthetase B, partial [Candidatus Parcubacteria bacterium]
MCGFVGFLGDPEARDRKSCGQRMAKRLAHRGPDDEGIWIDEEAGLVLAHRRLAILDLSPAGHQPMSSASGRFVVAYNGEIYNHLEIRKELEKAGQAPCWRGHADTETLLAAVEAWGVRGAVEQFVGMFAFALWDREERTLWLARDRIGEKPLYYGWQGQSFLFGSELKALRRHPHWQGEIDRDALALFMRHNYVPGPWSIYRGIRKLLPGTLLCLQVGTPPGRLP